uniref:Uncharacterized protein n=1 Tax=Arundo donax TaxID=35708 RepID=A0A0A9CJV1_ARUDO
MGFQIPSTTGSNASTPYHMHERIRI